LLTLIQIDCSHAATPSSVGLDPHDHRKLAVFYHALRCNKRVIQLDRFNPALLAGFHRPERDGRWSARRALLLLDGEDVQGKCSQLEIEAAAFREAFPSCSIEIRTSQGFYGHALINQRKRRTIRLRRPWFKRSSRLVVGDFAEIETPNNVSLTRVTPKISIIIPNHDRAHLTRLSAVAAASSHIKVPFEIICADNGSSAEELAALARAEVPLRVIELGSNKGFGEACNVGAKKARGEYLLFLNNDAFLRPGTVDELLAGFSSHPDCGAAGPVMLNIDDSLQEAGCTIQPDGFPLRHGRQDPNSNLPSLPRFKPMDYVSAACLMVKRHEFLALGGFAPKYSPAYYEDTDFCLRLLMRGKRVYLASKTSCYHIENATSRDIENGAWATRTSEAHRAIFLQDWAPYLASRNPIDFPKL
jgi:GT2 family glycosyltransferase